MITEEQRLARKGGLGGSDVAAIYGCNPWMTEWELWAEKTGRIEREVSGPAVHWGNRLESAILDEVEARHPEWQLARDVELPQVGHCRGNLDGLAGLAGAQVVVEAKTARSADHWTDGVPEWYRLQVRHYCALAGATKALVAVLIGGSDYREFELDFTAEELKEHLEHCNAWWAFHVVAGFEPTKKPQDVIDYSMPNGTVIDANEELVATCEALAACKVRAKELEEEIKRYEETLKVAMGSAVEIRHGAGRLCSWKVQIRSSVDMKRLEAEHGELLAGYKKSTMYRVFRVG